MIDRSKSPAVRPFGHLTVGRQTVETLSNGLTLHIISGGDQPVSRIKFLFAGGTAEIGSALKARITVTCLPDGSRSFPTEELSNLLDYNGIRISQDVHSHYSSISLSLLNSRVLDFMPVLADFICAPTYPDKRVLPVCMAVKSQVETSRREVTFGANERFTSLMQGNGHPLSHPLTESELDSFSGADAAAIHKQLLCPEKMHVFVSGMISDEIRHAVRSVLESIPRLSDGYEEFLQPFSPPEKAETIVVPFAESMQSAIIAGIPGISRSNPDYIPLRLSVMALGGYFGSRLMSNIREEKGLTYGISAALLGSREGSTLRISALCDKSYTEQVLNEIRAELRAIASNPPSGAELDRLKLHAMTDLAETLDTPHAIAGYYANEILVGTGKDYFEAQQTAIRSLTSEKIAAISAKYLDPENLSAVIAR